MPINPQHYGSLSYVDQGNQVSTMSFYFGEITATSIPGFLTEFGAFRDATNAISRGSIKTDQWVGDRTTYIGTPPSDQEAQRETKFRFVYQDDVTFAKYDIEVPVADLSLTGLFFSGGDGDEIDLAQTEVAAWVTAFETLCRSVDGNAVTVLDGYAVGRNL